MGGEAIDAAAIVRRNPRVVSRKLAGEGGVLLHLDSGAYHGVNAVGWTIWALLERDTAVEELLTALRARLTSAPSTLDEEVAAFLSELRERDLAWIGSVAPAR